MTEQTLSDIRDYVQAWKAGEGRLLRVGLAMTLLEMLMTDFDALRKETEKLNQLIKAEWRLLMFPQAGYITAEMCGEHLDETVVITGHGTTVIESLLDVIAKVETFQVRALLSPDTQTEETQNK